MHSELADRNDYGWCFIDDTLIITGGKDYMSDVETRNV